MKVTRHSLASALEGFYVRVGSTVGGMGTSRAPVADADETAEALWATLKRMAALHDRKPAAAADQELTAVARIVAELESVSTGDVIEDHAVTTRIVRYICDRYGTD